MQQKGYSTSAQKWINRVPEKWHVGLLVVISFLLYAHTLFHDFVYDDKIVIVENEHVTGGWTSIDEIWTNNYLNGYQDYNDGLYRPLSPTVFNVLHQLFGLNRVVFHLAIVLFYSLLVALVYKLFAQVFNQQRGVVFWGVLLFAVHPIHTEVVANVKSLDEILALLFGVAAILSALHFKTKFMAIVPSLFFYALALFSKESAIAFMLIIPVFVYFTSSKVKWKKVFLLFGGLLVLSAVWYMWHEHVIASMPQEVDAGLFSATSNSIVGIENPFYRFITGLWLVAKYFLKLIWPWPLYGDYSFNAIPEVSVISIRFLVVLLFLAGSAWAFFKGILQKKPIALGVLLFFICITPTSNVLLYIGTTFAERLAFAASLALVPLVVSAVRFKPYLFWVVLGATIAFLPISWMRAAEWNSNFSLFEADARRNPASYRTHYNYGTALNESIPQEINNTEDAEKMQKAIAAFERSLVLMPTFVDGMLNLGNSYKRLKAYDEALAIYDRILTVDPAYSKAYFNKGIIYYQQQNYALAREQMLLYIQNGKAHLGAAYYWAGVSSGYLTDFNGAVNYLNASLQLDDSKWDAWNFLGMAYGNLEQWPQAVQAFEMAYRLNASAEVQANLEMAKKAAAE